MKASIILILALTALAVITERNFAYPPAVGILGKSKSCLSCHVNNGPWRDDARTIIDILDKETMKSLRQPDGTFLLDAKRGQQRTVLTVIGRTRSDDAPPPYRNAWLYVDPTRIESNSLSKFAPGWAVNLRISLIWIWRCTTICGRCPLKTPGVHPAQCHSERLPADLNGGERSGG